METISTSKQNRFKSDLLRGYITNLGKYNEGYLVGEWVTFPIDDDELEACFLRIGIDGARYEEYFVSDYDTEVNGITGALDEYTPIEDLNLVANALQDLNQRELTVLEAALEKETIDSCQALMQLIESLDNYTLLTGVFNCSDLGYYWVEDVNGLNSSEYKIFCDYLNYEAIGKDVFIDEDGFFSSYGYICYLD